MNQWLALSKAEILFQARSGFLIVGVIITVLWFSVLAFVPEQYATKVLGLVLSMDVSSVALLFCMGLHLLERRQQVLQAFGVTPLVFELKVWIRIMLICTVATTISGLIVMLYVPMQELLRLLLICAMNSVIYAIIGYLIVIHSSNVSQLIVRLGLLSPLWLLPYLSYFDLFYHPLMYAVPTFGLTLMFVDNMQYGGITVINLLSFVFWLTLFYLWLHRAYPKTLLGNG
jgi:fluoroquinolone transport system permease protein